MTPEQRQLRRNVHQFMRAISPSERARLAVLGASMRVATGLPEHKQRERDELRRTGVKTGFRQAAEGVRVPIYSPTEERNP